jgi:hypothetical protein
VGSATDDAVPFVNCRGNNDVFVQIMKRASRDARRSVGARNDSSLRHRAEEPTGRQQKLGRINKHDHVVRRLILPGSRAGEDHPIPPWRCTLLICRSSDVGGRFQSNGRSQPSGMAPTEITDCMTADVQCLSNNNMIFSSVSLPNGDLERFGLNPTLSRSNALGLCVCAIESV